MKLINFFNLQVRDKFVAALLSVHVPADREVDMTAPNMAMLCEVPEELSNSSAGAMTDRLTNMGVILKDSSSSSDSDRVLSMGKSIVTALGSLMAGISLNANPNKNNSSNNTSLPNQANWLTETVITDIFIFHIRVMMKC